MILCVAEFSQANDEVGLVIALSLISVEQVTKNSQMSSRTHMELHNILNIAGKSQPC